MAGLFMIRGHFRMPGQEPRWPGVLLLGYRIAIIGALAYFVVRVAGWL
jgi:hypothetical protein